MDRNEACRLVENALQQSQGYAEPIECVVLDEHTIEKPWGWVFFYQSKAYIETGDTRMMLGGNAPIIVNRLTGELTHTGTAYDIDHYIKEYEATLNL